ncbi:MAG: HD domain-containing protein [Lachnospiraceae bacterium]|nr:HD domain-containing protein [Lachnospiraceae bacterium]
MAVYYYGTLFIISLVLSLIYSLLWHKHFSVYLSLIFLVIPISITGYLMGALADNVGTALLAQKIIYIGSCFLLPFLFLNILSLCNIHYPKVLSAFVIAISMLFYIAVISGGFLPIFYKSVLFVNEHGTKRLVKEYGFMHTIFLVFVVGVFLTSLAVTVYSYFKKRDVSHKIIFMLFWTQFVAVLAYFVGGKLIESIEMLPLAYVLSQILFIMISYRICMYDITESVADSLEQANETGIISLDFKLNYLGSNEIAMGVIPELSTVQVDSPIENNAFLTSLLVDHIKEFDLDQKRDKFYIKKGEKIYLADINYMYNGKRNQGYQILISDDTKNQEYISLISNYNNDLRKEVELKTEHIRQMSDRLILDMAMMVESRDNSTGGHIRRTSDCVRFIADEIKKDIDNNLTDSFLDKVIKAAPMHDLGKIAVDDAILRKPGRFEPEEFEKMKVHAAEGARIVHEILKDTDDEEFHMIAENVAHYHHERWDGSGYPEGLKGEEIPVEARIMAIADVYDALVSKRVYKDSMSFEQADAIITESFGKHFDMQLKKYYDAARPALENYYRSLSE